MLNIMSCTSDAKLVRLCLFRQQKNLAIYALLYESLCILINGFLRKYVFFKNIFEFHFPEIPLNKLLCDICIGSVLHNHKLCETWIANEYGLFSLSPLFIHTFFRCVSFCRKTKI